jgi:hypothetical protein
VDFRPVLGAVVYRKSVASAGNRTDSSGRPRCRVITISTELLQLPAARTPRHRHVSIRFHSVIFCSFKQPRFSRCSAANLISRNDKLMSSAYRNFSET